MRPRQPDAVGSPALCIDAQLFGSEGHHPAEDRGDNRDLTGQQRAPGLSGRPAGPVNGTPILAGLLLQQDRCSQPWACRRRPQKDGRNGRNEMHGCGADDGCAPRVAERHRKPTKTARPLVSMCGLPCPGALHTLEAVICSSSCASPGPQRTGCEQGGTRRDCQMRLVNGSLFTTGRHDYSARPSLQGIRPRSQSLGTPLRSGERRLAATGRRCLGTE